MARLRKAAVFLPKAKMFALSEQTPLQNYSVQLSHLAWDHIAAFAYFLVFNIFSNFCFKIAEHP
jgi:hypothetical protein